MAERRAAGYGWPRHVRCPDSPEGLFMLRKTWARFATLLALAVAVVHLAGTARAATPERIIVSGASGQLGELTVKALLARGVPAKNLILVSRTPEKLRQFAELGAVTRFGDFAKPDSLPAAYAGGTRMLLISIGGGAGPRPAAHQRAISAAVAAGVKHIVYTSWAAISRGDTTGIAADHVQTEEILKKSGIAWTILRNSVYMQGLLPQAARMVADGRAVVPQSETRIGYVTREDCAAAAAAVLTTSGHENRVYDITGPELVGVAEVAAAASAVTGRRIEVVPASPAAAAPARGFFGPSLAFVTTAVADLTGRPAVSVRSFFASNKAQLAPAAAGGGAADEAATVAAVIARLRVQEAPTPVRERKDWRAPRKVVVLALRGQISPERRSGLAGAIPHTEVVAVDSIEAAVAAAADADVLIGYNPEICDARIIAAARELRWIASLAAGVERCMALDSLHRRDLLMTNMRGVDSAVIAEHAIALALALAHGLDTFMLDTARAQWSAPPGAVAAMQALSGKTLLVVGLGGIGTEVASRAHGLGMNVIATRASGKGGPDFVSHVGTPAELLALARGADVVVNATPLTPETTHLFDARFFAVLKPTAYFINVARGQSVVTADLVSALNEHRLAGAGLDVVDPEPLPSGDPLWHAPHVILSPHISSGSDVPDEQRWILARENLRRYAAGERMLSVVDLTRGY